MKKYASELGDPLYPTINLINIGTAVLKEFGLQQLFNILDHLYVPILVVLLLVLQAFTHGRVSQNSSTKSSVSLYLFIYLFFSI